MVTFCVTEPLFRERAPSLFVGALLCGTPIRRRYACERIPEVGAKLRFANPVNHKGRLQTVAR
jgi:hypothetical protein